MPRHLFFLQDPALLVEQLAEETAGDVKPAVAPAWVNILPEPDAEGLIVSRDGRVLHIDDMAKLARRSNAVLKKQKGGGPIDADHKMYGGWFMAGGGSALGWAEEFEHRPGKGLWSRSEWLPEGKELIGSRQYRYTSSVVSGEVEAETDLEAWTVTWHIYPETVDGFAITNLPALHTTSMFSAGDAAANDRAREELLLLTLKKLGLTADAGKDQVRAAFLKFTATSGEVEAENPPRNPEQPAQPIDGDTPPLKRDDEGDAAEPEPEPDAEPEVAAAPAAAAPPPTPEPTSGGEDLVAQLAAARKRIGELETEAGKAFVDSLVHGGKMTPAQKPAALKAASTAAGLAGLRDLYHHAPQIFTTKPAAPVAAPASDAPYNLDPHAYGLAQNGASVDEIVRQLQQRNKENR